MVMVFIYMILGTIFSVFLWEKGRALTKPEQPLPCKFPLDATDKDGLPCADGEKAVKGKRFVYVTQQDTSRLGQKPACLELRLPGECQVNGTKGQLCVCVCVCVCVCERERERERERETERQRERDSGHKQRITEENPETQCIAHHVEHVEGPSLLLFHWWAFPGNPQY
jgi:hypothetical protein